ncbi:hypothetical protein [Methanoregula sp. UBA64]|uniref:hypothetical protein n=1 Tax=Methanoregula sp. UBA64 TaxID=1915554 RepID=UPI0025CC0CB9|nr:hypothetical protein [Methanoregula sp. UBA64]
MKHVVSFALCALLFACFACAIPAGAVVLEVTVKGTVSDISAADNTLTIANPSQYGCDYGSGTSAPVCSWTPLNTTTLSGTVPDKAAFSVFKTGDSVVAVSLGGTGGTWISLAKLYGSGTYADYATDEIGDIGSLPVSLIGDYTVTADTVPDCSACTGTTCTASASNVTIKSGKTAAAAKTLSPGQSLFFNGRNDASSVNVTFVKGEALSSTCPGKAGMVGGVQPVSDYLVHVVPPLSVTATAHETGAAVTAETSAPAVAASSAPVSAAPVSAAPVSAAPVSAAPATTQKSGLPFAALTVTGLGAVVLLAGRNRGN